MPRPQDIEKAKNVILGIIEQSGGAFNGKVRLFKTFYFAHLFHCQNRSGVLSDYPIVRMPRGPAIDDADNLFRDLVNEGSIRIGTRPSGPYTEQVYTLCGNRAAELTKEEKQSISDALAMVEDRSATELSEFTHLQSNTWEETPNGSPMNVYADLLDDSEYEQMKKRHQDIKARIDAAVRRRQS